MHMRPHTCVRTPLGCYTQEYVSDYLPRFFLTNAEPGDTLKKTSFRNQGCLGPAEHRRAHSHSILNQWKSQTMASSK